MKHLVLLIFPFIFSSCIKSPEIIDFPNIGLESRSMINDLYTYNGEYKLAELNSAGILNITAYDDIVSYEAYKDSVSTNDYTLTNFAFDSIYLTYSVFHDTVYLRTVGIPVFDIDGTSIKSCDNDCVEHTCNGDCITTLFAFCTSCDFDRYSCGYIKGCYCRNSYGCCIHTIKTCQNGGTIINDFLDEM